MNVANQHEQEVLSETGKELNTYLSDFILEDERNLEDEKNDYADNNENIKERLAIEKEVLKDFKRDKLYPFLIGIFFVFMVFHLLQIIVQYMKNIYFVDVFYFDYSTVGQIFWMSVPFLVFLLATNSKYKQWNFHLRKSILLWASILSLSFELAKIVYYLVFAIFIPLILKMPIVRGINADMLLYLMRMVLFSLNAAFIVWIFNTIATILSDRFTKKDINAFHIDNYINKSLIACFDKYSYNIKSIWKMSNGMRYYITQKDRFLHMLADGATGSGKTSSALIPFIVDDMDTKVNNEDALKKNALKAVKKGHIRIKKEFDDKDFSLSHFEPIKGHKKVLEQIAKRYVTCGITVMAPDASLTDKVYEFAKKRGLSCNRIDPEFDLKTKKKKEGWIGFNPLYISKDIEPFRYHHVLVQRATLVADVIQAIAEYTGKSEQYFTSINRNVITSFSILLELTYDKIYPGQIPTLEIVQKLANNFEEVRKYYNYLIADKELSQRYHFIVDFIQYDILGEGQKNMREQVRGLKMMLNELLANPSVKEILCAQNTIDMDKMLSEGQITVVNYSQEMGDKDAMALGLFFALSFNNAIMRRPGTEDTRIPHFYIIDELPVLLHSQFEKCFTLFRKYRVAMTVAIQTHDQMDRNDMTKYLRGTLLTNCAHQIIYGRINATEMELYQKLAGKEKMASEQTTTSQTAITSTTPSYSYSSRTTLQDENVMDGIDMRNRGFQEVTVFSVRNGAAIKPFHGRLSFIESKKKRTVHRYKVDWKRVYEDFKDEENPDLDDEELLLFRSTTTARDGFEAQGKVSFKEDTETKELTENVQTDENVETEREQTLII